MTASYSPIVRMMKLTDGRLGDTRYHQRRRLQRRRRPSFVAHIHVVGRRRQVGNAGE